MKWCVDSRKQPTIKEILDKKIIKNIVQIQLTHGQFIEEFSHTVLSNFNKEKARRIH